MKQVTRDGTTRWEPTAGDHIKTAAANTALVVAWSIGALFTLGIAAAYVLALLQVIG